MRSTALPLGGENSPVLNDLCVAVSHFYCLFPLQMLHFRSHQHLAFAKKPLAACKHFTACVLLVGRAADTSLIQQILFVKADTVAPVMKTTIKQKVCFSTEY